MPSTTNEWKPEPELLGPCPRNIIKRPERKFTRLVSILAWVLVFFGLYGISFPLFNHAILGLMGKSQQGVITTVSQPQFSKAPWFGNVHNIEVKAEIDNETFKFWLLTGTWNSTAPRVEDPIALRIIKTSSCLTSTKKSSSALLWNGFLIGLNGYSIKCLPSGVGAFAVSIDDFGLIKQNILFGIFVLLSSLVPILIMQFIHRREKNLLSNGLPINAVVNSTHWESLYTNSIVASYHWHGRTFKKRFYAAPKKTHVGETVTVLLNPTKPFSAVIYPSFRYQVI